MPQDKPGRAAGIATGRWQYLAFVARLSRLPAMAAGRSAAEIRGLCDTVFRGICDEFFSWVKKQ
jgi:hypothetical protein